MEYFGEGEIPCSLMYCTNCQKQYKFSDVTSPSAPLILYCAHTCCENCVREAVNNFGFITCAKCDHKSTPKTDTVSGNLRDNFPVAESLILSLKTFERRKMGDESSIHFSINPVKETTPQTFEQTVFLHTVICDECSIRQACCECKECNTFLCDPCFQQIHSSRTLKNHRMVSIIFNNNASVQVLEKCSFTDNKNKEDILKLQELYEKAVKKLSTIEKSLKILSSGHLLKEVQKHSVNFQTMNLLLHEYFTEVINAVNLKKHDTMLRFRLMQDSLKNSSKTCEKQLSHLQESLSAMLKHTVPVMSSVNVDGDFLKQLIEKLENYLSMPDTAILKSPASNQKSLEFSKNWLKNMEEECTFDFGSPGEICLISSLGSFSADNNCSLFSQSNENLSNVEVISVQSYVKSERSDDVVLSSSVPSFEEPFSQRQLLIRTQSGSVAANVNNLTVGNPSYPPVSNTDFMASSQEIRNLNPVMSVNTYPNCNNSSTESTKVRYNDNGQDHKNFSFRHKNISQRSRKLTRICLREGDLIEDVRISYVETPSNFYVQFHDVYEKLDKYRKMFTDAENFPTVALTEINKSCMYLAKCFDDNWYRVRVVDVTAAEDECRSAIMVFLVDVGRQENIVLMQMRKMDDIRKSVLLEPVLAIACCLFKCFPADRPTWSKEDIEAFISLTHSRRVDMGVCSVLPSRLGVDLFITYGSCTISLRDQMVFGDRAKYCSPNQLPVSKTGTGKELKYYVDNDFQIGDWINIELTHLTSPSEFYVQRVTSKRCKKPFDEMMQRLDSFFKIKRNYASTAVKNPVIGLVVAAQYSFDKKWYRGKITNIKEKLFVNYVDFGNGEWLPPFKVRLLPEEFTHITIQATRCCMKDILPWHNNWTKEEIKMFGTCVQKKTLQMVIYEKKGNILLVDIFENYNTDNVKSIGEWFVSNGIGKGIGKYAGIKVTQQRNLSLQKPIHKKSQNSVSSDKQKRKSVENKESSLSHASSNASEKETDNLMAEADNANEKPPDKKHQVNIISAISPNLLYLNLVEQEHKIINLMSSMLKFYQDENNNKNTVVQSVSEKMKCAVFIKKDERWCRAVILSIIDSDTAKVFLNDFATEEFISVRNVRNLPEKFGKEPDSAIRCSLANIEIKEEWSEKFCDTLKTELKNYQEFYMVNKGVHDSSLHIELWGKNVVCSGPLDPAVNEWTNINALLVKIIETENDVTNSECHYKLPCMENLKKFELETGGKNSTDHVAEWLQSNIMEAKAKGIQYSSLAEAPLLDSTSPVVEEIPEAIIEDDQSDINIDSVSTIEENEQWLSAVPLEETNFVGMPTYVDSDFNICVQISGRYNGLLDIINNGLESRYQKSQPLPSDMHWLPGQICIASFFVDERWYRGQVKEVNHKTGKVLVEYVDYGNIEWLEPSDLRKNVALTDIPIQCYKFPIRSDCVSTSADGIWPTKVLEYVHVTIVDKVCEIQLRREENEDFYRIEKLIIPEKLDLFDLLYQLNHAICTSSTKENKSGTSKLRKLQKPPITTIKPVHEEEEIASSDSSISAIETLSDVDSALKNIKTLQASAMNSTDVFKVPQITGNNEFVISNYYVHADMGIVTVEVTEILNLNEIVVNFINSETDLSVNEKRKLFLEMYEELQAEAFMQPRLNPPYRGRMCCTQFDDGKWYRALILGKCSDDYTKVPVHYIDYGNVSTVVVTQLRQLKSSWYHVPAQGVKCELDGVRLPDDPETIEKCAKKLSKALLNQEFNATIRISEENNDVGYLIRLMKEDGTIPYESFVKIESS